jgi:hypothetical protein
MANNYYVIKRTSYVAVVYGSFVAVVLGACPSPSVASIATYERAARQVDKVLYIRAQVYDMAAVVHVRG